MFALHLDLIGTFGSKTLERGKGYFRNQRVRQVAINETDNEIYGQVRGSGQNIYDVNIQFEPDDHYIEGYCSCPVGYNCKHVCAVLLEAEQQYGSEAINALLSEKDNVIEASTSDEAASQAIRELREAMEQLGVTPEDLGFTVEKASSEKNKILHQQATKDSKASKQCKDWLNQLTKAASKKKQTSKSSSKSTTSVAYQIRFKQSGEAVATLHTCRNLKTGGLGKPSYPMSLDFFSYYHSDSMPKSLNDHDQRIVKQAHVEGLLNDYQNHIELQGSMGKTLLENMIATGRCLLAEDSNIIIQPGDPIQPEVRWMIDEEGRQSPGLFDSSNGDRLNLIATEPPCYLKASTESACCGPLHQTPEGEFLRALLQAPPLNSGGIKEARKTLSSILPPEATQSIQLPDVVNLLKVLPRPILKLGSTLLPGKPPKQDSLTGLDSPQKCAQANLLFDYNGQHIDYSDPRDALPAEEAQIIPRHQSMEGSATRRMAKYFSPVGQYPDLPDNIPLNPNDLIAGLPDSDQYAHQWLQFVNDTLPELEDEGWLIEIEDDFPFQFEIINDSDWYARLDESEDNTWFSMKLGITIDGKPVDLLPLIARQIHRLPSVDELKQMKKGSAAPVALPGGKYVNLPIERLSLILSTLLELFGDRPLEEYRIENHHAQLWDELQSQLGLPWAGGEKLKALTKKLKTFKRLKNIKPARTLNAELRPYQRQGLSWLQFLRQYGLNGILADDMGLGKTLQTLAHIQLEKQRLKGKQGTCLVVCPTSLLHNWRHEAARFTPDLTLQTYHGTGREIDRITQADLVLTTYGIIQRDFEQLIQQRFHLLVLDEAQAVKNPDSKSAKAIRHIPANHKLCLTGTPMENHLGELWSLYDFLMPGFLGAHRQFTQLYRTPIEKHGKKEPAKRLQKRVAPFMLRRSKDLVAKELPPKTEIIRTTELSGKQRDLYETIRASMEAKVKQEIEKKGLARSQIFILDALLKMRQACCDPSLVKVEQAKDVPESAKLDLLMTLLHPMVEEGRKILLFSQFTGMLSLIEQRLKKAGIDWVKLTGQTRHRSKPIEAFQQRDVPVFLISLKAGGTGLNLTAADTVIHYDPWWNPAVEDQASDRAHRIGQDKPVFVYKLVTESTVEEKIQALKEKKRAIADAVYGDGSGKKKLSITAEDLDVLFEPLGACRT